MFNIVVASVGGTLFIAGFFWWSVRALVGHYLELDRLLQKAEFDAALAKELAEHRARLEKASADSTAQLVHEFAKLSREHDVRFTKLHERRAEVIEQLYKLLVECEWAGSDLTSFLEIGSQPSKEEKFVVAINAATAFYRALDTQRIFLPDDICEKLETLFKEMRVQVIRFDVFYKVNDFAPEPAKAERLQKLTAAWRYFAEEVPPVRRALEVELRTMLGDSSAVPTIHS